MATVLCHGLPSSFVDPLQKAELPSLQALPVTLRLKMSSQKPPADHGGWSFLQYSFSFSDNLQQESTAIKDVYGPPPARQSSSTVRLSERSLQLCTENLGSETGTDVSEGDSIFSYVRNSKSPTVSPTAVTGQRSGGRKVNPPREIPPPLTTLRGAETLHVRVHRQEGRLVINSVKPTPKSPGRFQAERVDGRLRLSLILSAEGHIPDTDTPESCDRQGSDSDKLQESEPDVEDQNPPARTDARFVQETNGKGHSLEGEHLSSKEHKESLPAGEEDRQDHQGGEDMTTEKLIQRPTIRIRCNEEEKDHHNHQNKMLHSWEPLWVATS